MEARGRMAPDWWSGGGGPAGERRGSCSPEFARRLLEKKCWRAAERSSEERRELEREDEEREEEEGRLGTATWGIYSRLTRQLRGHVAIVGHDRDLLRP